MMTPMEPKTARSTAAFVLSRRRLVAGGALVAGGLGLGLAYRHPGRIDPRLYLSKRDLNEFIRDGRRVQELRRRQTVAQVTALKKKYQDPVLGKVRVWDLIERLRDVNDVTDLGLVGMSQLTHAEQMLEAMESERVSDFRFFLLALLHDAGKALLLSGEVPENVLGTTRRLGEHAKGEGLDRVVYQFGHGEFIYSRIRDHVPPEVAFVARYHNIDINGSLPFMTAAERDMTEKFLTPFRRFDNGFKSPYRRPRIDMAKYRDLIEETFPHPILI